MSEVEDKIAQMKKLLKDYPLDEWIEAADGCEFCRAKYQVRITFVDETGTFGDVAYRITHSQDCPERFDIMSPGVDTSNGVNVDIAGWTYKKKPITFQDLELYPLESRANIGPCLICDKLVVGVPLILFINEGRGGELNFCFGCAAEKGILREALRKIPKLEETDP